MDSGKSARGGIGSRKNVVRAWSGVLLAVTLCVMGFFLWMWLSSEMTDRPSSAPAASAPHPDQERNASRFASPPEHVALEMVRQGLAVREPGGVAAYFHTGSTSPGEVVAFLRNMVSLDGEITGLKWLSSMDANGILIDGVLLSSKNGGSQRQRLALLTPDAKGVWKIDFDALARTVKPSWSVLLEMKAEQALVRVIVSRDSYYNGPFRNEAEWACYGMASPDTESVLSGYCRIGTPQARAMERILARADDSAGGLHRATLEIRRPVGAESRQFEITRVLAEDWILSGTAFDGIE